MEQSRPIVIVLRITASPKNPHVGFNSANLFCLIMMTDRIQECSHKILLWFWLCAIMDFNHKHSHI